MNPALIKDGVIVTMIVAILTTCFFAGWHVREEHDAAQLAAIKEAAAEAIATYNQHVLSYAQTVTAIVNDTEIQNAKNTHQRAADLAHYRALVAAAGGLRDPGTTGGGCPAAGPGAHPGSPDQTSGGGELSAEATDFLLQQANLADQVVDQYKLCQQFLFSQREAWAAFLKQTTPPAPSAAK